MNAKLRALLARKQETIKKVRAISNEAETAGRELTAEEKSKSDGLMADVGKLNQDIERETDLAAAEASISATEVDRIEAPEARADRRAGFQDYGEFAQAVRRASIQGGIDQRLDFSAAAPTTYGSEGVGQDGGFLVPPEFSSEIFQLMLDEGSVLGECDDTPVQGNSMVFPKDETTPWGTDGVRAYWQSEAQTATQTKIKLQPSIMRLKKLFALVPVTDELLDDAGAVTAYLKQKTATSINWKASDAIFNGDGAGLPQGFMNSNALVVQAKDSGQATKTISALNVANMFARLPSSSNKAQWFITPDAYPSLLTLTLGNYPIFTPPNVGLPGAPEGMLFGRPIRRSQHNAAFTSQGDLVLADLSWYRTITKKNRSIQTDVSMHLYFDADATAFRAIFRMDGQPKIYNAINQNKGSNTLSPFIALASR
jgi:HK97 family phage major capsid protein